MRPAIIYTLLGIQSVVFSAFIWVIDKNAESRSDVQRTENILKIAEVTISLNDLSYRLQSIEESLDDITNVWTLSDVEDIVKESAKETKKFIIRQDKKTVNKIVADQKKKYEVIYLKTGTGKFYKVYGIRTEEDYTIMNIETINELPKGAKNK